jgi:hypothetical protein
MSDRSAASILIGGPVKAAHLSGLCDAIVSVGLASTPADALHAISEAAAQNNVLQLADDEIAGGQFLSLERFCQESEISFSRYSCPNYSYSSELKWFDAQTGKTGYALADINEKPQIPVSSFPAPPAHDGDFEAYGRAAAAIVAKHTPPVLKPLQLFKNGEDSDA